MSFAGACAEKKSMYAETIYLIESLQTALVYNIRIILLHLLQGIQFIEWLILAYLEYMVVYVLGATIQEWNIIKTTDEDELNVYGIVF